MPEENIEMTLDDNIRRSLLLKAISRVSEEVTTLRRVLIDKMESVDSDYMKEMKEHPKASPVFSDFPPSELLTSIEQTTGITMYMIEEVNYLGEFREKLRNARNCINKDLSLDFAIKDFSENEMTYIQSMLKKVTINI